MMASEKVVLLNELDFDTFIARAERPVLVDFTAAWCGPCKLQSQVLEEMAQTAVHALFAVVDTDAAPALAARYGVRGMPTLLVFEHGREVRRRLGFANERTVRTLLEPATAPTTRKEGASP